MIRSILSCAFSLFCFSSHCQTDPTRLQGDSLAAERAEKLVERLGGKEIWSRSKHLYIHQQGWFTEPSEAAVERTWRHLTKPRQRMEIEGRHTETTYVFSEAVGWTKRKKDLTKFTQERLDETLNSWGNGSYQMIYRFAVTDPKLVLSFTAPNKVSVSDREGKALSWYDIDEYGNWLRWGTPPGDEADLTYVYGPVKSFGNISFPAWGAATNGSWRYEYLDVVLSSSEIDPQLLAYPGKD